MGSRRYEQRLRAEHADETRWRILDAVYQRLREAPTEPVGLDEIAQTRQGRPLDHLPRVRFEGRPVRRFRRGPSGRAPACPRHASRRQPRRAEHLRGGIAAAHAVCTPPIAISTAHAVLHGRSRSRLGRRGRAQDEGGAHRRHGPRRKPALPEDGILRDDVTVEEATDVLWMLCSFESFDLLLQRPSASVDRTAELITISRRAHRVRPENRSAATIAGRPSALPTSRASPTSLRPQWLVPSAIRPRVDEVAGSELRAGSPSGRVRPPPTPRSSRVQIR